MMLLYLQVNKIRMKNKIKMDKRMAHNSSKKMKIKTTKMKKSSKEKGAL